MSKSAILSALLLVPLCVQAWEPATDCRANIRAATCRVAALTKAQENEYEPVRPCLGGEEPFVTRLEGVHDEFPPRLQKMFCYLRKIYIEEDLESTGYAGTYMELSIEDGKKFLRRNGQVLGLSATRAFAGNLEDWMNHKEQTLFGLKFNDPLDPSIPKFRAFSLGLNSDPLLFDVVLHEFGHLFDFANRLSGESYEHCFTDGRWLETCDPGYFGVFPLISWETDGKPRAEDRYSEPMPCYYFCQPEQKIPLAQAAEFYDNFIANGSFVTPYASVNPREDLAESFAAYQMSLHFAMQTEKSLHLELMIPGQPDEILNRRLNRGKVAAKMEYFRLFEASEWLYESPNKEKVEVMEDRSPRAVLATSSAHWFE